LSGISSAQSVLDEATLESANIRNDNLYIAFSWQVRSLALRELRSFSEAENAARRSLDIHEREGYLENASYDWYLIASIRSLAGDTQGALQALNSSIELDRRVENSWGIAASNTGREGTTSLPSGGVSTAGQSRRFRLPGRINSTATSVPLPKVSSIYRAEILKL